MVDGAYITKHELVNQTAASLATDVSVMLEFNCDEAGVYVDDLTSPNATFFFCFSPKRPHGDPDGNDVPFLQLVVDHWAAFATTGDPNPGLGWLRARGHEATLREVQRTGRWEAVDVDGTVTRRILQWGGRQAGLGEGHEEVCRALGVPLDDWRANGALCGFDGLMLGVLACWKR